MCLWEEVSLEFSNSASLAAATTICFYSLDSLSPHLHTSAYMYD